MNPDPSDVLPSSMAWQKVPALVGSTVTESLVASPASEIECREVIRYCRARGLTICPKGSGRSYGDASLNNRNVLLDMRRMNRIIEFDSATSQLRVEAGTRIVDIFAAYHARGLTLPASPTDSTITAAGAMAANVNGKDAWRAGNFGDQVVNLRLMTASGDVRELDRQRDPELFLAVIGGMGLLGVVLELTLQLQRIPSPYLHIDITPAPDLYDLIRQLDELRTSADFIIVWIDGYASGDQLGRSVIHSTQWAKVNSDSKQLEQDVRRGVELLAIQKRRALAIYRLARPLINLGLHLQQLAFRPFNRFYYWLCSRPKRHREPELFLAHNFDKSYIVPPPDILCGPHGYTVQISIPYGKGREAIAEMLRLCRQIPCPPVTTILRLHRKDDYLISFSEDGYSLNVEFHPKKRHRVRMQKFMQEFIECGIRYGSKVHLPKDFILTRDQFRRLFPNYRKFLEIKRRVDPDELFQSDMYRRLFRDAD